MRLATLLALVILSAMDAIRNQIARTHERREFFRKALLGGARVCYNAGRDGKEAIRLRIAVVLRP
jgi:hypothetical protein